jgi:hypothetical protein
MRIRLSAVAALAATVVLAKSLLVICFIVRFSRDGILVFGNDRLAMGDSPIALYFVYVG